MGRTITIGHPDSMGLSALADATQQSGLLDLLTDSVDAHIGKIDEIPIAMWGYRRPSLLGPGVPWLVVSPVVRRHRKTFLRLSRPCLQQMLSRCPRLEATIDQSICRHLRYALWLGFKTVGAADGFYRVRLEAPCD